MFVRQAGVCLTVLLGVSAVAADDADVKKAAKAKAEERQTAFLKGEYEKFADLTHPKVAEASGGRKQMLADTAAETKKLKNGWCPVNVVAPSPSL